MPTRRSQPQQSAVGYWDSATEWSRTLEFWVTQLLSAAIKTIYPPPALASEGRSLLAPIPSRHAF